MSNDLLIFWNQNTRWAEWAWPRARIITGRFAHASAVADDG
jgi:hypothetical protein